METIFHCVTGIGIASHYSPTLVMILTLPDWGLFQIPP